MEEIQTLKRFIDNADFSPEIKKALFDCLMLELRKSPSSEYLRVIKQISQSADHED